MIKIKIKTITAHHNLLPGGTGDDTDPDSLDQEELKLGSGEEMEHTDDPEKAFEISTDHLTDNPKYYTDLKKAGLTDDKPLSPRKSKKLTKYWRKRAKKRALKAKRNWPNGKDKKWAVEQQELSEKINSKIKRAFGKQLEITEEISSTIEEILKRMKEAKFQKTTPKDLANRQRPAKPAKQKKGEKNPISGKVKRSRYAVGPAGSFGPA